MSPSRARITLKELLEQIERIPAEWLDTVGQRVVKAISRIIERIGDQPLDRALLEKLLLEEPYALDVFRLFLDLSQDILANELNARGISGDFSAIRTKASRQAS